MKFHRSAAVLASAVILSAGAVVTVNAVTATNPIKLCANTKSGAITAPSSSGSCGKGTTAFMVASDADVAALGARVDAAEATAASHGTRLGDAEGAIAAQGSKISALQSADSTQTSKITALENQVAALKSEVEALKPSVVTVQVNAVDGNLFEVVTHGQKLKPGTSVIWHFTMPSGATLTTHLGTVSDDGSFVSTKLWYCEDTNMYVTATAANDDQITSNVINKGAGCG